ncbi:MAG: FtsW/RodA/SpoVE family cell cycle protein [Candidatus Kaiserbacteria bacterium]|nr:MAG: FtsW/RodA/SpoVE family cell cycle protein [Candidatus Kaiserbacteria bacterium]
MRRVRTDKILFALIGILVIGGVLVFTSAALGLLARGATHISSVAFNHIVLGIGVGLLALFVASRIDYRTWRRFAPHLFVAALLVTAAVFIPGLGFEHGGGRRWINVAGLTFQPSEALKIGAILMAAAYFSGMRERIGDFRYGLGGLLAILVAPVILLISQPDLGTLGVIVISVLAVYFAAGAPWRDILLVIAGGVLALVLLATLRPYVLDRLSVFLNPSLAPQAEGYQIRQSLIAIGSGGFFGRGFGQGVQKFTYLPEPMGDSIFAVAAEEFGFLGGVALIGLFLGLALRGFSIAAEAPDPFGGLLAIGISTYLASEAFINIGAMLGIAPLTGIPLTFISQGASAMLISLGSAGILLAISRRARR